MKPYKARGFVLISHSAKARLLSLVSTCHEWDAFSDGKEMP
jgi:hypothetical protein